MGPIIDFFMIFHQFSTILARFFYDLGLIFGTIGTSFVTNSLRGSATNFGNSWVYDCVCYVSSVIFDEASFLLAQRVVSNKSLLPINSTHQKKVRAFRPAHAAQFARTSSGLPGDQGTLQVLPTKSVLQLCCWDDVSATEPNPRNLL